LEVKVNRIASRLYQQLVTNHTFSETTKIAASCTDIAKSNSFFSGTRPSASAERSTQATSIFNGIHNYLITNMAVRGAAHARRHKSNQMAMMIFDKPLRRNNGFK
jgi:hypothetical protein